MLLQKIVSNPLKKKPLYMYMEYTHDEKKEKNGDFILLAKCLLFTS